MYFIFFALWIIWNGKITAEIVAFGIVIAGVFYVFIGKGLGYKRATDIMIIRNLLRGIHYTAVLIIEVIIANVAVIKLILSAQIAIQPILVTFKTDLTTDLAKVVLANSITLTPGTITCDLKEDGTFVVHCLDRTMAEGMDDSRFVKLLRRMEGVG